MDSPIESLVLAVFDQYPDLSFPLQEPAEENRPEKVGVDDIGRHVLDMFPDSPQGPDLGDRVQVEQPVGRYM